MFSQPPKRIDRCEACKFAVTERRYRTLQYGSLPGLNYNPYEQFEVLVCKRMPPTANKDGMGVSPEVWPSDFCGEFESKDGE